MTEALDALFPIVIASAIVFIVPGLFALWIALGPWKIKK